MNKEDQSDKTRQQAIDGILFSPSNDNFSRRRYVTRRKLRGPGIARSGMQQRNRQSSATVVQPVVPIKGKTVEVSSVAQSSSHAWLNDQPVKLEELDPQIPKPRQKRRKKGVKKPGFFRRKWQRISGWSWKKKLLVSLLVLSILTLLAGGALVLKGYFNVKKVFKGGGSAIAIQKVVAPSLLKGEGDGRINILLLGIGGDGHEAPDLTDTIMIDSIDPVNHTATLLSVPRDLWVSIAGRGSMKLNAVYETGKYNFLGKQDDSNANTDAVKAGFAMADKELTSILGIPIHYNALVNFRAFKQAVDVVGGITVDVPTTLYDPTMAWENGGSSIIAAAGAQQFNGTKALMYVRSRETTSDFARAQRQRAVFVALANKVFTLGTFSDPLKVSSLFDTLGSNVVTDLALSDVGRLYDINKVIPLSTIQSVGLTDQGHDFLTTGMIGNQSVVYPIAGLNNYDAIQNYVRNTLRDGYLAKENAMVAVFNGTTVPNAATNAANILKSYGYNVGVVGSMPTTGYAKTIIVDLTKGKKPYTAQYLKRRYNVDATTTTLPDKTIQTQNADFVVILGQDEATSSQN